jgi:hypothetical protein
LYLWLQIERTRVPDGSAIAKAIDYSLSHWEGLGRFLLDGNVPLDNNHCESQIRPWALGRRNAKSAFMRSGYRGTATRSCMRGCDRGRRRFT